MAFNFNWSPLTADAEFYARAREMLTTALNKNENPPIIVDDILVNEFNLGSVPPDLEILEIGDLAEDRFRGIFKMCYSGDAFLTLKTRVQANPLNTYLFSKPSFTSPQPLAASSGLTIPLQITLSEIKLSAFIILVFSRQKGLTLVFRNDPLESLKVSSTFDSIPFVREYLQKTIEQQLRVLFMDELPAIIHRLSLRLWCPEYRAKEDQEPSETSGNDRKEAVIDPFASPPQDAVDARGNVLDVDEVSSLSLDGGTEIHSLFSQKNLLRLAALNDSHRTLSLFTPSIRDTVFRAWAGPSERGDGGSNPMTPSFSRTHSSHGSTGTTYTFNDYGSESVSLSSRPSLTSMHSVTTGLSLGSGRHSRSHAMRKKKTRVVNLRKPKTSEDGAPESSESVTTESATAPLNGFAVPFQIPEEPEEDLITPPCSPEHRARNRNSQDSIDLGESPRRLSSLKNVKIAQTAEPSHPFISSQTQDALRDAMEIPAPSVEAPPAQPKFSQKRPIHTELSYLAEKGSVPPIAFGSAYPETLNNGVTSIAEQAWMMKLAGEIARHAHERKVASGDGFWRGREESPPPAYEHDNE